MDNFKMKKRKEISPIDRVLIAVELFINYLLIHYFHLGNGGNYLL